MPLSPGDHIGPYSVLALAGKGGMGEVYRAHDDRLRRDVAIKVSRDQFSERFTREARTIASLNHTNIAHLYDVGPNYLVMEYVEGADLKGPLDFDDALPIIQQIIDGIEAAHEKNIIHRDLKPANIKITPEGVVKILDFGLAKAMEPADIDPENSPTLTMGGTVEGTILGTAAYMSPEQAKGKAADKRSDIWSFGVVVYEMLTGKRLFQGESMVEILGGVLNKEADLSAAPARVRGLLQWCLEKDRKKRLSSISDARRLLEESGAASPAPAASLPHKWMWPAIAAILLLIAAASWMRSDPATVTAPVPSLVLTIVPPTDAPLDELGTLGAMPVISPDGSAVLYGAKGKLYVRRLDSLIATPIPGSEQLGGVPFWSHDSASVYYPTLNELIRVRLPDGGPDVVTRLPGFSMSGRENANGDVVLSSLERMHLWSPSAGKLRPLEESDGQRFPEFLPDGKHVLYTTFAGRVSLTSLTDGQVARPSGLMNNATQASYTPAGGGRILFVRNDNLYSQELDIDQAKLTGESQLVQEGVSSIPGLPGNRAYFSVSDTGSIAWRPGRAALAQVVSFDRTGKPLGTTGPPLSGAILSLSPDGARLLAASAAENTNLLDVGQPASQDVGAEWRYWSADGTRLFGKRGGKGGKVITRLVAGGEITEVGDHDEVRDGAIFEISADGTQLLYATRDRGDLMARQFTGTPEQRAPRVLVAANATSGPVMEAKFSPDGRWILYRQGGLFMQPFPGPGLRRQVAPEGAFARWRGDGKEILFFANEGIRALSVDITGAEPHFGTPVQLFSGQLRLPPGGGGITFPWAVSRDGSRIYWLQGVEQPGSNVIQVRTNAVK